MLNKPNPISLALAFLCIATVFYQCFANSLSIILVVNKLEDFVQQGKVQSDLTFADLHSALLDFEKLDKASRRQLKEKQPLFHLVSDFFFVPLERHEEVFTVETNVEVAYGYLKRLEKYYKEFRPAYVCQKQIDGAVHRSEKADELIAALLNSKSQITSKMFRDASTEYDELKERFYKIGESEDILEFISYFGEFRKILNYLNKPEIIVLKKKIFPLLNSNSESVLSSSRDLFKAEMANYGYVVKNGALEKEGRTDPVGFNYKECKKSRDRLSPKMTFPKRFLCCLF